MSKSWCIVWAVIFGLASLIPSFGSEVQDRFQTANAAFVGGDVGEAAYIYRDLSTKYFAPGLHHNLGNAEWKVGRAGHAVLAWERALSLDPNNRNTIANLRFARQTNRLEEPERTWFELYSGWMPQWAWIALASVGLWGGIGFLFMPRWISRSRLSWPQGVAAICIAVFLLSVPALVGLWKRQSFGIVLLDETPLMLTPTKEGEPLVKLPAGEAARVERKRGEYFYVRASADRAGWVSTKAFALVWEK